VSSQLGGPHQEEFQAQLLGQDRCPAMEHKQHKKMHHLYLLGIVYIKSD
jgi:hypothetical protein